MVVYFDPKVCKYRLMQNKRYRLTVVVILLTGVMISLLLVSS